MFLPLTRQEFEERGWQQPDFVLVTGDAYVDHHSFGTAIIGRVLEIPSSSTDAGGTNTPPPARPAGGRTGR